MAMQLWCSVCLVNNLDVIVYIVGWTINALPPHHCVMYIALNPLSPHDALQRHFTSVKTHFIFLQLGDGFRMKISMKLVYQYMAIFFNF